MAEKTYAKGLYGKKPRQGAPDFVLGSISVKVEDFIPFLHANVNEAGYVNIDILSGKEDKLNCVLNEWKPKAKEEDAF